jgi:hypothetical protein
MRQLTLKGFLKPYLQYLSGEQTLSVSKLVEKLNSEPRLVHPLMLWAVLNGQASRLMTLLEDRDELKQELCVFIDLAQQGSLEKGLEANAKGISEGTLKVWNSYRARRDAPLRDEKLKQAAHGRALALEKTAGVSRYRMAKDLKLNSGNLHAFLAFGDVSKMSLDKAYQLIEYLQ